MKRTLRLLILFAGLSCLGVWAQTQDCSGLPTSFSGGEFPTGNFFSNFDNICYLIPFSIGYGSGGEKGDLNSIYNKIYYNINPDFVPYEIIILGTYPNARYFSITVYDNHSAVSLNLDDADIVPLTSRDVNPFEPGVAYVAGQHYAVPVNLGGTPGNIEPGCSLTGFNVDINGLDGTQRHPFMNWNLDPLFALTNPPPHQVDTPGHTNPNTGGAIIIRSYLDMAGISAGDQPHVIVRDVASGCAYPAAYVASSMDAVTSDQSIGSAWINHAQAQEHTNYENWLGSDCWGAIADSTLQWSRGAEYTPGGNPDAGYQYANVPAGLPQSLANAGEVFRFRFRVPTTPPTPCTDGCSRAGDEQMRYTSISFQAVGGITLESLPDHCPIGSANPCMPLVQDANGYVTLAVSTGTPQPSWVTADNGYTWLDLSQLGNPDYLNLNQIAIRDILPAGAFDCAASNVPYHLAQATTGGAGVMGLYAPVVDFPVATSLPPSASPVTGPSTCAVFPAALPKASPSCGLSPLPLISISSVVTQCAVNSCSQVVIQPHPPLSISGAGFGYLPLGLPYTGNSNFLRITDTTQNWSAGYTGNPCNVNIGEWSDTLISLLANVNEGSACLMAAGDQLAVTVWNPQTLATATYNVTVMSQ